MVDPSLYANRLESVRSNPLEKPGVENLQLRNRRMLSQPRQLRFRGFHLRPVVVVRCRLATVGMSFVSLRGHSNAVS